MDPVDDGMLGDDAEPGNPQAHQPMQRAKSEEERSLLRVGTIPPLALPHDSADEPRHCAHSSIR